MEEFSKRKADRDILVNIIVKKHAQRSVYLSQRNASTDFPVLACAVCLDEEGMRLSIGQDRAGSPYERGQQKPL